MKCKLCSSDVQQEKAMVPAIAALRQALRREPNADDLADHAFCRKCAPASRGIVSLFSYQGTLAEIGRRKKQREEGKAFFSMQYALKSAGVK